jgi:hypothetical protein
MTKLSAAIAAMITTERTTRAPTGLAKRASAVVASGPIVDRPEIPRSSAMRMRKHEIVHLLWRM